MPVVATFVRYTQTALNGGVLLLSSIALFMWASHLVGPSTSTSMAHAFVWTAVAVGATLALTAAERLTGA